MTSLVNTNVSSRGVSSASTIEGAATRTKSTKDSTTATSISSTKDEEGTIVSTSLNTENFEVSSEELSSFLKGDHDGSSLRTSSVSDGAQTKSSGPHVLESQMKRRRESEKVLESLTINKLRFNKLGLYGRDEEIHQLKDRLESLLKNCKALKKGATTEGQRELIMIKGYSGTGKSALASTLRKPVEKLKGLFVSGKFDLYMRDEPLTALASACARICGEILALANSPSQESTLRFETIQNKIIEELGSELAIIVRFVPALEEVAMHGRDFRIEQIASNPAVSPEESKNQLNFAIRRFIRTIGSFFAPLVIMLDDLQWADMASLEVLDVLITDRENSNLMIVGLYRDNEVSDTHPLAKTLRDLDGKMKKGGFRVTNIEVGNLTLPSVHKIIEALLQDDSPQTVGLAEVCLKKTGGNVFFLIRFLSMLTEKMLLTFNIGTLKWMWDVAEIETSTEATDNVVDLLKNHIQDLPKNIIEILKICAFLGSTFKEETLVLVLRGIGESEKFQSQELSGEYDLDDALSTAEKEGLFEKSDDGSSYKWIHDKVQEASVSLIDEKDRGHFGHMIGEILVQHFDDIDLESNIFIVVNLLNDGSRPSEESECIKLADLNLRAAKKAALISSFASAAKYAAKGIDFLTANSWASHHALTLDLYCTAAEAEGSLGNTERTDALCNIVLERDITIEEKFRAYFVLIDSVIACNRELDGLMLGLELLDKLGCKFPRTKPGITFRTLSGVMRAKSKIKEFCSTETLDKMSQITEPRLIMQIQVLYKMVPCAYMARKDYLPLFLLRSLFLTMKHGLCEFSPAPFAGVGLIFAAMNDLQAAATYGRHANVITERMGYDYIRSHTMYMSYYYSVHWVVPYQQLLKPLFESYEAGMKVGDVESAGWGIGGYLFMAFQACRHLDSISEDARVYSRQLEELGKAQPCQYLNVAWQVVENLRGRSEDPFVLTGDAMDEEVYTNLAKGTHLFSIMVAHKMMLYGYMGAYEKGADLALKYGGLEKEFPGASGAAMCTCLNAVSCCEMAHRQDYPLRRKCRLAAQKFLKAISSWVQQGNPNMKHWESLVTAECEVLRGGKTFQAKKHYESAIALASRFGFNQDAAFACERYGEFLLREMDDKENGVFQLQQAVLRYSEWGAYGKVDVMNKKYAQQLGLRPEEIVTFRT